MYNNSYRDDRRTQKNNDYHHDREYHNSHRVQRDVLKDIEADIQYLKEQQSRMLTSATLSEVVRKEIESVERKRKYIESTFPTPNQDKDLIEQVQKRVKGIESQGMRLTTDLTQKLNSQQSQLDRQTALIDQQRQQLMEQNNTIEKIMEQLQKLQSAECLLSLSTSRPNPPDIPLPLDTEPSPSSANPVLYTLIIRLAYGLPDNIPWEVTKVYGKNILLPSTLRSRRYNFILNKNQYVQKKQGRCIYREHVPEFLRKLQELAPKLLYGHEVYNFDYDRGLSFLQ